jgi:hypothetical protein
LRPKIKKLISEYTNCVRPYLMYHMNCVRVCLNDYMYDERALKHIIILVWPYSPRPSANLGNTIHTKPLALNNRSRQLRFLLTSKHVNLKNKLLLYKLLLKPIWTYGIQLWGAAKPSNITKIQSFQSKCLRQITKTPFYVSNDTLHKDLSIQTVKNVAKTFYKRMHSNLQNHRNLLISKLSSPTIPGDPRRRLKQTLFRDLFLD